MSHALRYLKLLLAVLVLVSPAGAAQNTYKVLWDMVRQDTTWGPTEVGTIGFVNSTRILQKNKMMRDGGLAPVQRHLGMVIPLYHVPEFNDTSDVLVGPNRINPQWWFRQFCDAIKKNPELQYYVIVNPSNGPGTTRDERYETAIRWLHGSGATVLMYNTTGYTVWYYRIDVTNGRNSTQMKAAIDTSIALYPEIDGVFLDEVPFYTTTIGGGWPTGAASTHGPNAMACLDTATNYANSLGLITCGNPGSYQADNKYYENGIFDILIARERYNFDQNVYIEGKYARADSNSLIEIPQHRKAAMVHTSLDDSTYEQLARQSLRYRKYHDHQWLFDSGESNAWGGGLPWNTDRYAKWVLRTAELLKAQYTALVYDTLRVGGMPGITMSSDGRIKARKIVVGDTGLVNYSKFDSTGILTMLGNARPWRDEKNDALSIKNTGTKITENLSNGTLDFSATSDTNFYATVNVQLNHDRDQSSVISPHIHWLQTEATLPRWVIGYRWIKQGARFDTLAGSMNWNYLKCGSTVATYTAGIVHQIAEAQDITPPTGSAISDIVQFRIIRDVSNKFALWNGTDSCATAAGMLGFDVHIQMNSLGSKLEYTK